MSVYREARKVTTHTLQEMKRAGEKITMLTAYDYSLARLVDHALALQPEVLPEDRTQARRSCCTLQARRAFAPSPPSARPESQR